MNKYIISAILALSLTFPIVPAHAQQQDPKVRAGSGVTYANGNYDAEADTLDAARITTDRIRQALRTQTGLTKIDSKKLKSGFALFNSPDVIKTIQRLPGVASGTELLSGLYVHGGTGSDNLYLLDGYLFTRPAI